MNDHSHLRGIEGDDEQKSLINHEGGHDHSAKDPRALLDQMKYISSLIEKVSTLSKDSAQPKAHAYSLLLPLPQIF